MPARQEKTLVLIKPDAIKRGLVGKIITQYENGELKIEALKWLHATDEQLSQHYQQHAEKGFYQELIAFMKSGPIIALVLSGPDAVAHVRKINGATQYLNAELSSIRGKYGHDATENLVHGSDSTENAQFEIDIWFPKS